MPFIASTKTQPVYDVIVVGSGAAGGQTAYVLAAAGVKVLILEAGRRYDPVAETPMFNTNHHAPLRGVATPAVKDAFQKFSSDGFAGIVMDFHGDHGHAVTPQVWKGMPVLELINEACNFAGVEKTADILSDAISRRGSHAPGFYFFRVVWTDPSKIAETVAALRRKRPDLKLEVLGPDAFFSLFKESQERQSK